VELDETGAPTNIRQLNSRSGGTRFLKPERHGPDDDFH